MSSSELLEFLEETAGKYHRGTVRYDGANTDVLYLRDDLREELMLSQIDQMLTRLRPEASSKEERSFPFGDLHTTVRAFDEAIILHFPIGHDRGVVVSLASETAQNLNTFIGECTRRIQG
ncbi:hypothetical protein HUG10_19710 (plasmid) [Halorarum halophilum]|uniref:Roadblock/LAMTOR2 domain-containing protein n=1 Tax=Halorarum halophilum TaxID=2743090 RepID=A0A7D5KAF9_9EURY|nr:hypothetical protein [Halobaculum halophilum]QLG29839.1 hypothetical protein HUG10_19710 [Halobaculum halophilum]